MTAVGFNTTVQPPWAVILYGASGWKGGGKITRWLVCFMQQAVLFYHSLHVLKDIHINARKLKEVEFKSQSSVRVVTIIQQRFNLWEATPSWTWCVRVRWEQCWSIDHENSSEKGISNLVLDSDSPRRKQEGGKRERDIAHWHIHICRLKCGNAAI